MSKKTDSAKCDLWKRFRNYDFADAKPVNEIPALRQLQTESGKKRVAILRDSRTRSGKSL